MPRLAAAFALAAAGCARLGSAQEAVPLAAAGAFEQFVKDFEKEYDEVEREARYAAFVANYALVQAENAKEHSYKLGINEFADMTQEEFAMTRFGLRPSERKPWGKLQHLGTHVRSNQELPESVDWRDRGAVQKVKNQGSCGSCWAFSSAAAMEGAWQIATGKLVSISEQQLIDCSRKQGNMGCQGGMMDNAFEYEEGVGVCSEESYSYKAKSGICSAATCEVAIPKGGIVGFKDVASDDEEALMDAIVQQPVSVAIEADQLVFQLYKGGVLDGKCGTKLDHGVVAVGYGIEDGKKYWLIRNSWGASWGEDGYIKLLRGNRTLGEAGECGILTQPSYPVAKAPAASTEVVV